MNRPLPLLLPLPPPPLLLPSSVHMGCLLLGDSPPARPLDPQILAASRCAFKFLQHIEPSGPFSGTDLDKNTFDINVDFTSTAHAEYSS